MHFSPRSSEADKVFLSHFGSDAVFGLFQFLLEVVHRLFRLRRGASTLFVLPRDLLFSVLVSRRSSPVNPVSVLSPCVVGSCLFFLFFFFAWYEELSWALVVVGQECAVVTVEKKSESYGHCCISGE